MKNLILLFIAATILFGCANEEYFEGISGEYLGQKPPGKIPEIFAPNIVSTGFDEQFGTFTSDLKEFYYIIAGPPDWTINVIKQKNGKWLKPQTAEFSVPYTSKFCISPNGKKVILTSIRAKKRTDILPKYTTAWFCEKTNDGWTEATYIEHLDSAFAPNLALNGTMYFHKIGYNKDIYLSKYINGTYTKPINLGDSINSLQDDVDPFIAPDESFLIFSSNRDSGTGIYISYKRNDGLWTKAKSLGEEINSINPVNVGSVSPDGKYIFLFSNKYHFNEFNNKRISYDEKLKIIKSPGNGSIDIYWVDASIIQELKPTYIK